MKLDFGKFTRATPADVTDQEATIVAPGDIPADDEKIGWVSPAYTVSRPVMLSPQATVANRCVAYQEDSAYLEYYRVLRSMILQRTSTGSGKTVMITSVAPGEGKSLTAINLAFTFARDYNHTTLLVDCDLRQQSIHRILGYAGDRGLADYLTGKCPLSEVIVWPGVEKLAIISGGKTVGAGSELLGSPRMQQLVSEVRDRYADRYVLLDAPPVLAGADAMTLALLVDHILVVVQSGRTSQPDLQKSLQLLPREKIIGLVFNRQSSVKTFPHQTSA